MVVIEIYAIYETVFVKDKAGNSLRQPLTTRLPIRFLVGESFEEAISQLKIYFLMTMGLAQADKRLPHAVAMSTIPALRLLSAEERTYLKKDEVFFGFRVGGPHTSHESIYFDEMTYYDYPLTKKNLDDMEALIELFIEETTTKGQPV